MDDFAKLYDTEHMLNWFADEPYAAIRSNMEEMLGQQVAGSRLNSFTVTSEPQWLTGGRRDGADDNQVILVRSAVAFEFAMSVEAQGKKYQLSGVYTWAAVHLDQPGKHKHRVWMDLDGNLATFGADGELKNRVYFE